MTPEENWNGPVQDAIKEHDRRLGHYPFPAPAVAEEDWFRRFPNGGTAYLRPDSNTLAPVDFFRYAPNGGGTVFLNPECIKDGGEVAGGENGDK